MKPEQLQKGDLVVVRWTDASDTTATLEEHQGTPETTCKDWGIFLGISGTKHRFIIVGKDVAEANREWGATRIPVELVEEILLILPASEVRRAIAEIDTLSRRIRLRKHRRGEARDVCVF